METIISNSNKRIHEVDEHFKRYLFSQIDWNDRLIGITGARGTGKTTLVLQALKAKGNVENSLYLSLDDIYFSSHSMTEVAEWFISQGGKFLFLDEVHKYASWSQEVKSLYDNHQKLKIVFTGSSVIEMAKGKGDLSRRASMHHLHTMSFREFLEYEHDIVVKPVSLEKLLSDHVQIATTLSGKFKPLKYFREYLKYGSFPFYNESKSSFYGKLKESINVILENDLPSAHAIEYSTVVKMKKLMMLIAEMTPFKPNVSQLAEKVDAQRKSLYKYLDLLQQSCLLGMLPAASKGLTVLNKPEKIYLGNPSLMYALSSGQPDMGTLRETFFFNQLSLHHTLAYHPTADFLIDKKYVFEIGGKNKDNTQILGIKNAWIAADDIETGYGQKIPLWLFGLLY